MPRNMEMKKEWDISDEKLLIENEPRTLDTKQLQLAREAALHVMKTQNIEEALKVFTKGLEPTVSAAKKKAVVPMPDSGDRDEELNYPISEVKHSGKREIASAPF